MSDLPYKLAQIAKSLQDMGKKAWGDAVAAAGDEIERLKVAATPGPSTETIVGLAAKEIEDLERCGEPLEDDDHAMIRTTAGVLAAFIAENEPES